MVDDLKKGRSDVVERGHVVILGWNHKIMPLVITDPPPLLPPLHLFIFVFIYSFIYLLTYLFVWMTGDGALRGQ